MNNLRISEAAARIDDASALERLLAPIPNSEQIRPLVGSEFFVQGYDQETRRDTWVGSDGSIIVCVTIVDIGVEDAARVRLLQQQGYEEREERGAKFALSHRTVTSLVSEALGVTMNTAN